MPRLNYAAPGVYVEEVPSAQQPIAGVGTNTVGFIGLVPEPTTKSGTGTTSDDVPKAAVYSDRH